MGTRGLTRVIKDGVTVVSQYGQWDHYPSGQGIVALEFLNKPGNIARLIKGLQHTYVLTADQEREINSKYSDNGWMNVDQMNAFNAAYPSLTRDTGAAILEIVAAATEENPVPLVLDEEFIKDEAFCEGVYTIDLDNRTFTTNYHGKELKMYLGALFNELEYLAAYLPPKQKKRGPKPKAKATV